MARSIKSCDFPVAIAVRVFKMLNNNYVEILLDEQLKLAIITDVEPKELIYPEGWYFAKGYFRNKHTSSTGIYDEIPMMKKDGTLWGDLVKYCTLE